MTGRAESPDGPVNDVSRLRTEYAARAERLGGSNLYSLSNPAHLFTIQQRQRDTLRMLHKYGVHSLAGKRILEVGCGYGGVLQEYASYDATPGLLHGIDLLRERLVFAHSRLPHLALVCADGQHLPYLSGKFDLVLQYTAFSSILDPDLRGAMAREMIRVLCKPDGLIVWYDFWLNPTNPQTVGMRPAEIRRLFPGCIFDFQRITLAPPLARHLVKVSWPLCCALEKLRVFNSHYLVAIRHV